MTLSKTLNAAAKTAGLILGAELRSAVKRARFALSVVEERRALSRLSPRELQDVGLSADQARLEADRAIWDVPRRR